MQLLSTVFMILYTKDTSRSAAPGHINRVQCFPNDTTLYMFDISVNLGVR